MEKQAYHPTPTYKQGLKMSPGVQDTIKSAKATVTFLHHSTKATEKLKELQVQLKLPANKIIIVTDNEIVTIVCTMVQLNANLILMDKRHVCF